MKALKILPYAALLTLTISGCDKQSAEITRKVAELERKNQEAEERQRELEQQLQDQMLASERDAIERERARIEDDRAELECQEGPAAAEQDEALRKREQEIANREGKLEQLQSTLDEKEDELGTRYQELSERDREVAGREALAFDATEQNVPVADYGTFYDSLSSYGSWFETPDYGYVWQPAVVRESNWRPYSRGRWVCSDRGWTWVSDEPFGWATYHYGRWALIGGRGWIWVPGSEWAPCWVSWRENNNCIGWAPLPPETLAWRGHRWDNTVDVRFGIGSAWFNFVEIRNFGSPLYRHCLPVSANAGFYGSTTNITHIHLQNQQVICGGPRYKYLCDRIGEPLPFCRLEIDHHPKSVRDPFTMRPYAKDGKLRIFAPNMDVAWNDSLRPKQVRGRIEEVRVQRDVALSTEITEQFRRSREDGRQRAEKSIADLGGRERFEEKRVEQLNQNRRLVDTTTLKPATREATRNPGRAIPGVVAKNDGPNILPPPRDDKMVDRGRPQPGSGGSVREDSSRIAGPQQRVDGPNVVPPPPDKAGSRKVGGAETARVGSGANRVQEGTMENKRQDLPARVDIRNNEARTGQAEQLRKNQQAESQARENQKREQQAREDQASRNKQLEDARQRQAQQAKEAQANAQRSKDVEQAEQRKQQDVARRQQAAQEVARRQQQDQQKRAIQQQQESARQRQQEGSQRQQQQEQSRQQQQPQQQQQQEQQQQEQSRQRQQEQSRQQQDDNQGGRNKRNR
jgi:hypothetical protein